MKLGLHYGNKPPCKHHYIVLNLSKYGYDIDGFKTAFWEALKQYPFSGYFLQQPRLVNLNLDYLYKSELPIPNVIASNDLDGVPYQVYVKLN